LRLDFGPGRAIGHGKIGLLEAIRDYGSISAAGRSMGMSYRRAWLLIDELNGLFRRARSMEALAAAGPS
jgi:molybdate transport system regulatory protein